ncbi:putative axial regulator YABBY 2 [Vitis vinifera]|uniref:Putative axial regulator YABBY 2 n=1 Tax=Vitis vinifera TaxID=29760 RepID=A0A438CEC6_VITVI|nr:putative axial regulator YABBY 2 [Vitis vinifera]
MFRNSCWQVSVPCTSLFTIVTVRCGHCANCCLLTWELCSKQFLLRIPEKSQKQQLSCGDQVRIVDHLPNATNFLHLSLQSMNSQECLQYVISLTLFLTVHNEAAPEKRQRVPSALTGLLSKEEIQRIKASNPDITHREAFSTAAQKLAHFPHIHFGLKLDGNKQGKLDQAFAGEGPHKAHGFY